MTAVLLFVSRALSSVLATFCRGRNMGTWTAVHHPEQRYRHETCPTPFGAIPPLPPFTQTPQPKKNETRPSPLDPGQLSSSVPVPSTPGIKRRNHKQIMPPQCVCGVYIQQLNISISRYICATGGLAKQAPNGLFEPPVTSAIVACAWVYTLHGAFL